MLGVGGVGEGRVLAGRNMPRPRPERTGTHRTPRAPAPCLIKHLIRVNFLKGLRFFNCLVHVCDRFHTTQEVGHSARYLFVNRGFPSRPIADSSIFIS